MATPAPAAHVRAAERARTARLLRRGLIGFAVLFLAVLLIAPFWIESQRVHEAGSSFGVRPEGFRGALEVLGELGYDARRWMRSYGALRGHGPGVLVVLDPMPLQQRPDEALLGELVGRLETWVERGGVLVYAPPGRRVVSVFGHDVFEAGDTTAGLVEESARLFDTLVRRELVPGLHADARVVPRGPVEGDGALAAYRGELTRLPERVERGMRAYQEPARGAGPADTPFIAAFRPMGSDGGWEVLVRAGPDRYPLVVERRHGRGRVIVFSTAWPFANAALRWGGAAPLVAEVMASATDRGRLPVLFDEYVHGFTRGREVTRWVTGTPLGRVLATALLGVLGLAWFGMVRFGPAREPRRLPRRAKEEFVTSLADLYQRAGRRGMAARSIVHGLAGDLARLRGLDREGAPMPPELAALAAQAERQPPRNDRALLSLATRALAAWRAARERMRGRDAAPPPPSPRSKGNPA